MSRMTAMVTGGGRGLGLVTARQMAEIGYRVVLTVRRKSAAEEARKASRAATTLGATISVTADCRVPTLSTVTNLLKTGTAKGHVFMSSTTKVGLSDVVVTYKSVDSGYVYRTICKADGSYRVMFLPPGDYVASGVGTAEARVKTQKLKVWNVVLEAGASSVVVEGGGGGIFGLGAPKWGSDQAAHRIERKDGHEVPNLTGRRL